MGHESPRTRTTKQDPLLKVSEIAGSALNSRSPTGARKFTPMSRQNSNGHLGSPVLGFLSQHNTPSGKGRKLNST